MSWSSFKLTPKFYKFLNSNKLLNEIKTYYTYVNEPTHYIKKEPCWTTPKEALGHVLKSGNQVVVHGAGATPTELLDAMADVGKEKKLKDIKVYHIHLDGKLKYVDPEYSKIFRSFSFFMGGNVRKAVAEGRADCISIFLHEIPKMFYRRYVKPDISLIHVSPPDNHGFCTLGTSVDIMRTALKYSNCVIALVNPCMPRTFGDSIIHVSHIDYAVAINRPLLGSEPVPPNKNEQAIGKLIAENLIEDGSTLQMGIGAIPDAVLHLLKGHKNLGIHSEMIADGVVDLYYAGAVTNALKKAYKGRTVASFIRGGKRLYEFLDNNPSIEMLRVEYVNDAKVICQQPRFAGINSCIEIDLTGQVVSDSIGTRMYSGFGGQVDFIRGTGDSFDEKGKPIIAMTSITKKKKSKISPFVMQGAGIVTSRAHCHYVVTEFGIAFLYGKSLRQRAYELIKIAHPDHRAALEKAAFERLKVMPGK